jgi:excisionase family DNA binding protein
MSDKPEKLITPREAAEILNVDPATVRRYVRLGVLPARRLPSGYIRLRRPDVERLLREEDENAGRS